MTRWPAGKVLPRSGFTWLFIASTLTCAAALAARSWIAGIAIVAIGLAWILTIVDAKPHNRTRTPQWRFISNPTATISNYINSVGEVTGIVASGPIRTAVIELVCAGPVEPIRDRPTIAVDELVPYLRQHEIQLSGIDLINYRGRGRRGVATRTYRQLTGPLRASTHERTWVAVHIDVTENRAAIALRRCHTPGAATVAVAAQRIARALASADRHAFVLDAAQLSAVRQDAAALRGMREIRLRRPRSATDALASAAVPDDHEPGTAGNASGRADVAVSVHLRPSAGRPRSDAHVAASTLVGTPGRSPSAHTRRAGLEVMLGRHARPAPAREHLPPLPVADRSQLIGATTDGRPIFARLVGTGIKLCTVQGEMFLARQIVLRAIATGNRILIATDRPGDWQDFARAVDEPGLLQITTNLDWADNAAMPSAVTDSRPAPGVADGWRRTGQRETGPAATRTTMPGRTREDTRTETAPAERRPSQIDALVLDVASTIEPALALPPSCTLIALVPPATAPPEISASDAIPRGSIPPETSRPADVPAEASDAAPAEAPDAVFAEAPETVPVEAPEALDAVLDGVPEEVGADYESTRTTSPRDDRAWERRLHITIEQTAPNAAELRVRGQVLPLQLVTVASEAAVLE